MQSLTLWWNKNLQLQNEMWNKKGQNLRNIKIGITVQKLNDSITNFLLEVEKTLPVN